MTEEEAFWECAISSPLEAQSLPMFALITLAEPARWISLENDYARDWIEQYAQRLTPKDQRLFACDCVDHAIASPIWKQCYNLVNVRHRRSFIGSFHTVQHAIKTARDFASGLANNFTLGIARNNMRSIAAIDEAQSGNLKQLAYAAQHCTALDPIWPIPVPKIPQFSAAEGSRRIHTQISGRDEASRWQWYRLLSYLIQQPPETENT